MVAKERVWFGMKTPAPGGGGGGAGNAEGGGDGAGNWWANCVTGGAGTAQQSSHCLMVELQIKHLSNAMSGLITSHDNCVLACMLGGSCPDVYRQAHISVSFSG